MNPSPTLDGGERWEFEIDGGWVFVLCIVIFIIWLNWKYLLVAKYLIIQRFVTGHLRENRLRFWNHCDSNWSALRHPSAFLSKYRLTMWYFYEGKIFQITNILTRIGWVLSWEITNCKCCQFNHQWGRNLQLLKYYTRSVQYRVFSLSQDLEL